MPAVSITLWIRSDPWPILVPAPRIPLAQDALMMIADHPEVGDVPLGEYDGRLGEAARLMLATWVLAGQVLPRHKSAYVRAAVRVALDGAPVD